MTIKEVISKGLSGDTYVEGHLMTSKYRLDTWHGLQDSINSVSCAILTRL